MITREQYESDVVIVTLEWVQNSSFHSYHIRIIPWVTLSYVENSKIQFNVSYNTPYNVSTTVVHQCRQNNLTIVDELNYSKCQQHNEYYIALYYDDIIRYYNWYLGTCQNPVLNLKINDNIRVLGYDHPAIMGTNITFHCFFGLIISGCQYVREMENGNQTPKKLSVTVNWIIELLVTSRTVKW